jgi:uracil-DNA glycosylase
MIRPQAAELSPAEMRAAAPALLGKLAHHAPKLVVFVGKVNWTHVRHALAAFSAGALGKVSASAFGLQPAKLVHARGETLLYVVPSTSGLCRVKVRCSWLFRRCGAGD